MTIAASRRFKIIVTRISVSWVIIGFASLPSFAQTPTPKTTSTPTSTPTSNPNPISTPSSTSTSNSTGSPPATPKATPSPTLPEQVQEIGQKLQLPLISLGVMGVLYLGVLWIKPLWLLKLPATDIAVPFTTWKIPLSWVRWFKYRSRVLDVWVECRWATAQDQFLRLPTVESRKIHISLPVELDQKLVDDLKGQDLQPFFKRKSALVLITGEGGAGKTSLACQIALWGLTKQLSPHRILPVLVETELDEKKTLLEAIRGQLKILSSTG